MRALLDEQLTARIALDLRSRGLDVQAVTQRPDLVGQPDEAIMATAAGEARAVVTNNVKDFRPIAAARIAEGAAHAGLILVPATRHRTRAATGALVAAIEQLMRANPNGIADSERWIAPW